MSATGPGGPPPRRKRRRRRQQPKRSFRVKRTGTFPVASGPPPYAPGYPPGYAPGADPSTVAIDLDQPLPGQETTDSYPGADEAHAVTTNQEPRYSWPPVDLPPLSGFTVGNQPTDNGQAYMDTTFDAAPISSVPYNDYTTGADSAGPPSG